MVFKLFKSAEHGGRTLHGNEMIAKVITRGPTREAAINKMRDALAQTRIQGVNTNLEFLLEVLSDPEFAQARMTTRYVELKRERAKKAAQTAAVPT